MNSHSAKEFSVPTAVIPDDLDSYGFNHIYVHGARIADPYNSPDVTWDQSVTPTEPVFVIAIKPAEDEGPYRDALRSYGLTVTGTDDDGNWTLDQVRPL